MYVFDKYFNKLKLNKAYPYKYFIYTIYAGFVKQAHFLFNDIIKVTTLYLKLTELFTIHNMTIYRVSP